LASVIANLFRLARAGLTLARYGVSFVPKGMKVPPALRLAR
jgi:ubiquinone biosynthesis protein